MFNTAKDPNLATAVYYIKNSGTGYYTAIHGPTAESFVHQFTLGAGLEQRWTISKQNDGYYTIKSKYGAEKYIGVTGNASGTDNVQLFSTVSDSTRWKVFTKSGGDVLLEPKTAAGMIVWAPNGIADTELQLVRLSIGDSNSKHLWKPIRMLPTNGCEISYQNSAWDTNVIKGCNCYSFALNSQVYPSTNDIWYMRQPGEYAGDSVDLYANDFTIEDIVSAVEADYHEYNSNYSLSYSIQPINKYSLCPQGTYKIALVYGTAPDGTPDYHWYRQDYNGLWLHKRGTLDVESVDSDHMLIIDPEEAARDYSTLDYEYNANYYTFVGFFSITPWNNCFVSTDNPTYWSSGEGGLTLWRAYLRFIGLRYYCENEDDGIYPLDIKRSAR